MVWTSQSAEHFGLTVLRFSVTGQPLDSWASRLQVQNSLDDITNLKEPCLPLLTSCGETLSIFPAWVLGTGGWARAPSVSASSSQSPSRDAGSPLCCSLQLSGKWRSSYRHLHHLRPPPPTRLPTSALMPTPTTVSQIRALLCPTSPAGLWDSTVRSC